MFEHHTVGADFTGAFQVRFDECAVDGTARASSLLRYTIETAFGHSAREGFPLGWYDAHGLYWLVRRARLELVRPVPYGSALTVTTEVVGFRRVWARRQNVIRDMARNELGEITMDWIFTDRTGNPTRIVADMEQAFPVRGGPFRVEHLEPGVPPTDARWTDHLVRAHQLDPRGHMNASAYVDLFEDALIGAGVDVQQRPAVYGLEFLRPALPGQTLRLALWAAAGTWTAYAATAERVPVLSARRQGALLRRPIRT